MIESKVPPFQPLLMALLFFLKKIMDNEADKSFSAGEHPQHPNVQPPLIVQPTYPYIIEDYSKPESEYEKMDDSFLVEAPTKNKKRLWMWIWICIAILLIAGIITAVVVIEKNKSSDKLKSNASSKSQPPSDNDNIPTSSEVSSSTASTVSSSVQSSSVASSSTSSTFSSTRATSSSAPVPTSTTASTTRASFQTSSPECPNPRIRREWRELSSGDQQKFLNAVKALKTRPSSLGRANRYEDFVFMHWGDQSLAHKTPMFFPWHRRFIQDFENALRQIDSSITLPYWDTGLDSQRPESSPIFNDDAFGGSGDPSNGYCITKGTFAGWNATFREPHCVKRRFQLRPWAPPEDIGRYILNDRDCNFILSQLNYLDNAFRAHIEDNVHSYIHIQVGGDISPRESGDFKDMRSPNDPLFFVHHANVDRYYYLWQMEHPNSPYGGNENDLMPAFEANVASTKNTLSSFYCYRYSTGSNPGDGRLSRRQVNSNNEIKIPDPPSKEFVMMNGGNYTAAMEAYRESVAFIQELNKNMGYVSPAVLYQYNRDLVPVNATYWRFGPSRPNERKVIKETAEKSHRH